MRMHRVLRNVWTDRQRQFTAGLSIWLETVVLGGLRKKSLRENLRFRIEFRWQSLVWWIIQNWEDAQDYVLGYFQPDLSKLAFFDSVHPPPLMPRWATALNFVIPSAAEFPATLLRDASARAVFCKEKPHEARQRHQPQQEIRQAEGPAVRPSL
jgi:hypothetical protein